MMLQLQPRERYAIGVLSIILVALVIYFGVVFPRDADRVFPWSSDAWGHLIKAVYLREQIGEGQFYPDLFPSWYSGQQLLRYFPPLSYYLIVGLNEITGNIFTAGNLYIFGTSLIGGLSFLLFAPRIGFFWAIAGGILFIVFPDNIRVAFAEGNLPRLAATAFLPAALFFLFNLMENPRSKRNFTGLVVMIGLIVLSHAMMAGIFLLGLGMYVFVYWLIKGSRFSVAVTGGAALISGLLVSGWWLLPSLSGGISELDNNAASEAIASFPVSVALNPGLRSSNNEVFYVGISMLILLIAAAFLWKRLDPWVKALLIVTFVMTLIGTTFVIEGWRALPGHQLLWPLRFMSFAALGLVLTSVIVARETYLAGAVPHRRWLRLAAVAILVFVFVDFQPSLELVRNRERPGPVQQIADELAVLDGWRVATADLSKLGSAPAMLFTSEGEREQVFGWAFQGSITGPLLARVNQSLTDDYLEYGVSRLGRLGTDDVVIMPQTEISPGLGEALEADGYTLVRNSGELRLYHRDGKPRAFTVPLKVLGIGSGANNAALVFPQIIVGSSDSIEDYSDPFLEQFDLILLSRFEAGDRSRTEERIKALAERGLRFIVDMSGAPVSPLTRQPKFLGIHGEPVLQIERATLIDDGERTQLAPFFAEDGPWRSVTPQGADEDVIQFEYIAATGAAVSRNRYGSGENSGEVLFVGLNLLFHTSKTRDPIAIALLEELIGLEAFDAPPDLDHPLDDYEAGEDGWSFDITLQDAGWVLFPMAYHAGTRVLVNGNLVESTGIERLTLARMPAGTSSVEIRSEKTGIYTVGYVASIAGVLLLAGFLLGVRTRTVSGLGRRVRRQLRRSSRSGSEATGQSGEETVAQA